MRHKRGVSEAPANSAISRQKLLEQSHPSPLRQSSPKAKYTLSPLALRMLARAKPLSFGETTREELGNDNGAP
ncbi:hypothetical protein KCU88_g41, partial [Aureobasidium melanogenum]